MSTHSFTPVLEPKTQAFVDSLDAAGGPPLYTLTPDAARAVLADAQAAPIEKLRGLILISRSLIGAKRWRSDPTSTHRWILLASR